MTDEQQVRLVDEPTEDDTPKAAMTVKKIKKTKPPGRRVYADDLVVTVDDVEYHPHAGEYVEFRGNLRLDTLVAAMKLSSLGRLSMDQVSMEEAEGFEATAEALYADLTKSISEWDWTDDNGKPYASPPEADTFRDLGFDEVMWLVGGSFGGSQGPEDRVKD